jgi:psp operon transcriptional activator
VAEPTSTPAVTAVPEPGVPTDFRAAVANFERQVLRRALERAQFKQTVAAKVLGLSYHQFRSLLRKHGLAKQGADNGG